MREIKVTTLKNGLKIVFIKDTNIHSYYLDLFVNFGGYNQEVLINNKKVNIPKGTAHFLEHMLIEKSKYGNLLELFSEKNINFNGITNYKRTYYYISTIHNFKENIRKLIVALHDNNFKEKDIAIVKQPIEEEIQGKIDENFDKLNKMTFNNLFSKLPEKNISGSLNDIDNINYGLLELCHDIFYVPSNEILFISGNIEIDDMINFVESIYNSLSFKSIKYKLPKIEEPRKIKVKEDSFKTKTNCDYTRISYKIDISFFKPYERVKLSYYLYYVIKDNFSSLSTLNSYLIKNNITVYDLDISDNNYYDNYLVIEFGTYTNKKDELVQLINKQINNLEFNEETFKINKNKTIIDLILEEERFNSFLNNFIDNILLYDYYDYDKIENIEKFNFLEYKEMINKLDFSNYTINSFIKK